jgi:puromycin-sensitive aminopeptidase
MAFAVVDAWRPEWRMWQEFQHGRAAALDLDALRHTHPIFCEVRTPAEASENFDLITYEKGASVVRMLERYLGEAAFRRGVRRYIRRHCEGNATASDLWHALGEASGEPVEKLARAWIEQPGHPVLELRGETRGGRHRLRLRQRRFRLAPRGAGDRERWPIPWIARVGGPVRGRGRLVRQLVTGRDATVDLGRGAPPRFVYGNAEESGFLRPVHGPRELASLLASVHELAPVERMGLVDHQWALVRGGRADAGSLLRLADALAPETDPDVLLTLERPLAFLARSLVPDAAPACEGALCARLVAGFGPALEALGLEAAPGEPIDTRVRRAALLELVAGIAGDPRALAQGARLGQRYLASRTAVDANLADVVVGLAAREGDAALWRSFVAAMRGAATPQEQRRFLLALGAFHAPAQVERSLALALGPAVPTQDVVPLLVRLLANPAARETTFDFVKAQWPKLRRRMPPLLAGRLVEATWQLLTPARRRDVARFFAARPLPSGERALRQTLERFDWYAGFRARAARELARELGVGARRAPRA